MGQGRPGPGLEGRGGRPWSLWPPFTVERSWLPPCTPKAERWGCRKTRCPMGTTAARLVALALDGHPRAAGPGFGTSCRGQPTSPRAHTIDITSCSGHSPASRSLDSRRTPPQAGQCAGRGSGGPPLEGVRLTDRRREAITHQSLPPTPPACRAPTCFLLLLLLSLLQLRLLLSGGTPGPCRDPTVWGSFPGLGPFFLPVHDTCFHPEIRGSQERG